MSKKKKIVIPTDDEVSEYGGSSHSEAEPSTAESVETGESSPKSVETADGHDAGDDQAATDGQGQSEAEEWKEKCLRAKAELANFQRRVEKDRVDSLRYANANWQ